MAIETLFGPSIADVQELRRQQQEREIAGAGREFGVFAPLYQASLRFGNQAVQGANTLLGAQDPMLKKATAVQDVLSKYASEDPSNPVTLEKIGRELMPVAPDAGLKALTLAKQLTKDKKLTTVAPGATVINERGEVVYEAPNRDQVVKTPADFAAAGRELGFGVRPNIGEYSQEETIAINNLLEGRGIKRAEAGVPRSGEVRIGDLSGAQGIVKNFVGAPKERLDSIAPLRSQLREAKAGSGAALEQVRGALIKLVGDSQISATERARITGSSGVVENAINYINTFFTGVPTQEKFKELEKIVGALEDTYAGQYNKGLTQAGTVLAEAKLPEATRKALLPPAYKTGREKTAESLKGQDKQAYDWAKANPTDSRSTAILNRLGVQ